MLQTELKTWDKCVKLAPRRDCDHMLLFKQATPDSLSYFYLYSFSGLHEQFYNQFSFLSF